MCDDPNDPLLSAKYVFSQILQHLYLVSAIPENWISFKPTILPIMLTIFMPNIQNSLSECSPRANNIKWKKCRSRMQQIKISCFLPKINSMIEFEPNSLDNSVWNHISWWLVVNFKSIICETGRAGEQGRMDFRGHKTKISIWFPLQKPRILPQTCFWLYLGFWDSGILEKLMGYPLSLNPYAQTHHIWDFLFPQFPDDMSNLQF